MIFILQCCCEDVFWYIGIELLIVVVDVIILLECDGVGYVEVQSKGEEVQVIFL